MKTIKINEKTSIDLQKLIDGKLLVQANSGGGKSWLIRRLVEQAYGKVQIIILDPEGEFSTLREKFDFVLAGKDGDTPAEPKSAAMLAKRLLELKVSAIVDLYELHPQERKHFVRLFLEAMVNIPKQFYNPVLVVLDEAHMFAPEKGESEALNAVIGMASLGRKREQSLILATQRISKLHKDAAAEMNNKLIGRSSLDIDRKRAADELGITGKEEILALRTLKPGEFFAFGPAISDEVIKITVGDVQTTIPKGGASFKVTPPTPGIKKILGKLADLPAEAKKEAMTVAELRKEIGELRRHKCDRSPKVVEQKVVEVPVLKDTQITRLEKVFSTMQKESERHGNAMSLLWKNFDDIGDAVSKALLALRTRKEERIEVVGRPVKVEFYKKDGEPVRFSAVKTEEVDGEVTIGEGERKILIAIGQHDEGISREHLTILTGYKRSTRDAYIQRLLKKFFIERTNEGGRHDGGFMVTEKGIEFLGNDFKPLPTGQELLDHLFQTLPEGEGKILSLLVKEYPEAVTRDDLTEETGYQRSTRDSYIQRLSARKLVEFEGRGRVKASDKLFV